MSIEDELSQYSANLIGRIGSEAAEILFAGQIGEGSKVLGHARGVGDLAPKFVLPGANGKTAALDERLRQGPVVLSFYRGGWCPFCNIALRALQSSLPAFRARGASLIAVSPEIPDQSLTTAEKLALEFDVLSDQDSLVARSYGLIYKVSDAARQQLLKLGRNLVAHNGTDTWELPVTATYVIGPSGVIEFAHIDADYRARLDPATILSCLDDHSTCRRQA